MAFLFEKKFYYFNRFKQGKFMRRLVNLDYLRGICAFGIMIFHYTGWGSGDAGSFMGRLGIYGVSIFYILSGLTLHHVYSEKMQTTTGEILTFFKKRIFRIFPLLWLATILSIFLFPERFNLLDLVLNLSGLFGFFRWDHYFAMGAWSIGNELVFYVFFPLFLIMSKYYKIYFKILTVFILIISLCFTFIILDQNLTLVQQWRNYVNPLNQVFLFLGGFLIFSFFAQKENNNKLYFSLLSLVSVLFVVYPVDGDSINIVTGFNRIVFMLISFTICISFYKIDIQVPNFIDKPLSLLGEASYSVYLLHPIVLGIVQIICKRLNISGFYIIAMSIVLTLIISYFVYKYFEKYFIRRGNNLKLILNYDK